MTALIKLDDIVSFKMVCGIVNKDLKIFV